MARTTAQLDPETLSCCLCLDLLKDPVTTSCGHSYCRKCLQRNWDEQEKNRRAYSCPQCRTIFKLRPVLQKNIILAALAETLKKTGLQAAPADHCYAGAGDVACDLCIRRKLKALKSCLDCRASYCDLHLQPHLDAPPLKRHKLMEPSQQLQENICPRHDEMMKIFCRTDQKIICGLCLMDEHQGHHTVSTAAERTKRQKELEETRQKIQHTEEDLKVLQKEVKSINDSADKAVKDSEEIFTQIIRQLKKRRSEVQQQVRSTQGAAVSRVKELQEKLEQEMMKLKSRDTELEKISNTLDHNQFLNRFSSLPALSPSPDSSRLKIRPLRYFEDVAAAVTKLRDEIKQVLMETQTNISWTVSNVDVLRKESEPEPEPRTREDFLRYSRQITLDPNTVNKRLVLSEENRRVTVMEEVQSYCDHPDRFTDCLQVLSKEGLTGRCYWEVEWRGLVIGVAVAYKDISREGAILESLFGYNDKSWSLDIFFGKYRFHHNNIMADVSGPQSSRLGVYLDHRAGLLSFYSVSGTMKLLHIVQTSFTQPLHVGLYVGPGSAELMKVTEVV